MSRTLYFKCFLLGLALAAMPAIVLAQIPYRATAQDSNIVLTGGTVHVGDGRIIENGVVILSEGKITYAGDGREIRINMAESKVLNTTGKHIYPGLIAMNTYLGLAEYEAVRATLDYGEVGNYNPDVRSIISYNTDSRIIPTVRSNGVLLAQVAPQGGIISGLSSVMQLDAWNWEDAGYQCDEGIHLNWPYYFQYLYNDETALGSNDKYEQQVAQLRQYFAGAKAYAATVKPTHANLRYEAMKPLFSGKRKLYVHAAYIKEILSSIEFGKELGLQIVIVGGYDAWKCADALRSAQIPVVLQRTHSLPADTDDDVSLPYTLAACLQKAGVLYCITDAGYWQQRNLPFQAGHAAGYGLTREQALQAVTLNPAKILGIADRTGTIEAGKDANIVVSDGDMLDMAGNHITLAYIQGRSIDLYNSQQLLYDTYKKKYGLK